MGRTASSFSFRFRRSRRRCRAVRTFSPFFNADIRTSLFSADLLKKCALIALPCFMRNSRTQVQIGLKLPRVPNSTGLLRLYYKGLLNFLGYATKGLADDGREQRDRHRHEVRRWLSAPPRGRGYLWVQREVERQLVLQLRRSPGPRNPADLGNETRGCEGAGVL